MAEPRIRRCATKQEFERAVDDLAVSGYKIQNRSEESALLEKKSYGSVGVHILLACFTFGLGNIIYAITSAGKADKVMVRLDVQN